MKKSVISRILSSALALTMAATTLCGTAFAATAEDSSDNLPVTASQAEEMEPALAPPPVMEPIYNPLDPIESKPKAPIEELPVPPAPPVVPVVVKSPLYGLVRVPQHDYYDYALGCVMLTFEYSDASKIGFLYEIAEPAMRLEKTLADAKEHLTSAEHKPVCTNHDVEWALQENMQDMGIETGFAYVSFDSLVSQAEYLVQTKEYKALKDALTVLHDAQPNDQWLLTRNYSAEQLASMHDALETATSFFWPDQVATVEHTRFEFPMPFGFGYDVDRVSEPACG